jgi:hypothetical protein
MSGHNVANVAPCHSRRSPTESAEIGAQPLGLADDRQLEGLPT